jgi:hypothetical protein
VPTARFTLEIASGRTCRPPLSTRETVLRETPAARATSSIVGRFADWRLGSLFNAMSMP